MDGDSGDGKEEEVIRYPCLPLSTQRSDAFSLLLQYQFTMVMIGFLLFTSVMKILKV